MKLNSFKFQDGKVFWLPEYPEKTFSYCSGKPYCCEGRRCDVLQHDDAIAQSLASAIEVAPEDMQKVKRIIWWQHESLDPLTEDWPYDKDKVYSAECEMETGYQWKTSSGYIPVGKAIYDYWSKSSSKSGRQVARLKPTKEHLPKPNESNRDWPEDHSQENGNYQNKCCLCELLFYGNKHRVVCRQCDSKTDMGWIAHNEMDEERMKVKDTGEKDWSQEKWTFIRQNNSKGQPIMTLLWGEFPYFDSLNSFTDFDIQSIIDKLNQPSTKQ